jgi:phage terminase small subunit
MNQKRSHFDHRLTVRQRRFVDEYVVSLNGAEAARKAGISEAGASVRASKWLANAKVKAAIDARLRVLTASLEIKAERVILELARIATADMANYFRRDAHGELEQIPLDELPPNLSACIQEIIVDATGGTGDGERRRVIRTRFKLCPKVPALELLGRRFAMFTDRKEQYSENRLLVEITERLKRRPVAGGRAQPAINAEVIKALSEDPHTGGDRMRRELEEAAGVSDKPQDGQQGQATE